MTIKDIARESGFAIGTVSRALNNAPGVSAETRQKILEVVNRHNYEPNANAKHLKQQANDGIALIVKGTQNMLFADILEQLQSVIEESGYVATVYYIDEEANEVAQARRICAERKPYGILFLGSNLEYFTPELEDLGIPCLLLTNSAATLRIANLSSVSVDDMAASAQMIEYLYKQGHRRIGIIGGKPNLSRPSLARLAGCQSAMLRLGLPCLRLFFRLRHKPCCGHGRYGRDADADVQQILERAPGRLHTECTGHAAARVGGYRFHAPSGCQHCRCHRGTGKAGCRKAEGRVCRAQRSAQHRTGRKRGFGLPFAA